MKQKKKNIFYRLDTSTRLAIIYSIIPTILVILGATLIFYAQKEQLYRETRDQLSKNLNNLIISIISDKNKILEENDISLNSFRYYISTNKLYFDFDQENQNVEITNNSSGVKEKIDIVNWTFRDEAILNNNKVIMSLSQSLKSDLIIAQKTKSGYVNICSTNPEYQFLMFPYSVNMVFSIENGEIYEGIEILNGKKVALKAAPMYINGKIKGMLISIKPNKFSNELSELFAGELFFRRGYPFIIDPSGKVLIHPQLFGRTIAQTEIFSKMNKTKTTAEIAFFEYNWPENDKSENKILIIKFVEELDAFVGITIFENTLHKMLNKIKVILFIVSLLTIFTNIILIILVTRFFLKRLKSISNDIRSLSKGIIPEINIDTRDSELVDIINYEKTLVKNFTELEYFCEQLKNKNYNHEYVKWSSADKIGENLLDLNQYLRKNLEEEKRKKVEQEKLIWLNEGVSKFIEILKYEVIEIKELAYKIISQIVEYVDANEGGFFIVSKNKNGEKQLELLSAYGMGKEKLIDRKIPFGVGLQGRIAIEKKMLFLTEIPDSYTKISTALGQGKPSSIVLLPLIFNDDIIGVIEVSSFKVMTQLQLSFLEKITENISANLAMWQASQQTTKLLEDSREQARIQEEQQRELQTHLRELEELRTQGVQREIELNSMIKAVDTTALLIEYDTNGIIISANNKFLETLEKSELELIGRHHKEISSMSVDSPEYKDFWQQLIEGKTKRFIEAFPLKDKTVWLSQNYVPIMNKQNDVFKILNIAIDVTENKVLEKQLRAQVREISKEARVVRKEQRKVRKEREEFMAQELFYKAVIAGTDIFLGQVRFSTDGLIEYSNSKFAEILNYSKYQIERKNILSFVPPENVDIFKIAIKRVKNNEIYSGTINFIDSQNKKIDIDYSMTPLRDSKNLITKIIMIIKKK